MTLDELILEQQKAAIEAKRYQERDRELRGLIWGMAFAAKGLEDEKQHTIDLGNGYKLKGKRPVNYKVDAALVDDALDAVAKCGNTGAFVADRLVKFEPRLSLTEYKQLTDDQRKAIDTCLTTTPGQPVIELIEPKEKK